MKPIPAKSMIAPSMREMIPFRPRRMGSSMSTAKYRSFLMMELCILIGCPASATSPKISVKSAMFPPRRVPTPIPGSPLSAEIMLIKPSGSDDTMAIRMKLVTNSVSLKNLAMCVDAFTANSALFTSTMQAMMNTSTSFSIRRVKLFSLLKIVFQVKSGCVIFEAALVFQTDFFSLSQVRGRKNHLDRSRGRAAHH